MLVLLSQGRHNRLLGVAGSSHPANILMDKVFRKPFECHLTLARRTSLEMGLEFSLYIFWKGSVNHLTSTQPDASAVHVNPSATKETSPGF